MCAHLDGLNAEHRFPVRVTILGHTSLQKLNANLQGNGDVLDKKKAMLEDKSGENAMSDNKHDLNSKY